MWERVDPLKIVRNTRTLTAYRQRQKAAMRRATPFLFLPVFLNFALFSPALQILLRRLGLGSIWLFAGLAAVWLVLMCAAMGFGVYRMQRYLRDHPLTGDLEGVGR